MKLGQVNIALDHRIVGGSDYGWKCYGPDARFIDYESDFAHVSVIFDPSNQTVYSSEVSIKDTSKNARSYRWLNPEYKDVMYAEATARGVNPNQAWDDVLWYDLETPEDFLEKATAMFNGEEFDTRISVPLDLEDDLILSLAIEAHKRDITLNKMVEIILVEMIERDRSIKVYS